MAVRLNCLRDFITYDLLTNMIDLMQHQQFCDFICKIGRLYEPVHEISGTYRIGEQRRLRRACSYAQTLQGHRCSQTQSMDVDKGVRPNFRHLVLLDRSAWVLMGGFCAYAINTKYSLAADCHFYS